jgi:choline dehydrogenase-like flavoprotein
MSHGIQGVLSDPPELLKTDILVIGSGPGGSVTASVLSEAGREVLCLEEGPFLSLNSAPQFSREEMIQKYRNGGLTVALGKAKVSRLSPDKLLLEVSQ